VSRRCSSSSLSPSAAAPARSVTVPLLTPRSHKTGYLSHQLKGLIPSPLIARKPPSQWESEILARHSLLTPDARARPLVRMLAVVASCRLLSSPVVACPLVSSRLMLAPTCVRSRSFSVCVIVTPARVPATAGAVPSGSANAGLLRVRLLLCVGTYRIVSRVADTLLSCVLAARRV
jgi:hypothetical protein